MSGESLKGSQIESGPSAERQKRVPQRMDFGTHWREGLVLNCGSLAGCFPLTTEELERTIPLSTAKFGESLCRLLGRPGVIKITVRNRVEVLNAERMNWKDGRASRRQS